MQPLVVQLPGFYVAGQTVRTTNQDETRPETAKIPALWSDFSPPRPPRRSMGSTPTTPPTPAGHLTSPPAARRERFAHPTRPLSGVPARGAMPAAVIAGWQAIWAYFEQHPEIERRFLTDFETYTGPEAVDIHIGCR